MSAAPARLRPAAPERREATRPRTHLAPVATPSHDRSILPFLGLCLTIVAGALVGVLLLNTSMAAGAYEARDLKISIAESVDQRNALVANLDAAAAPDNLAAAATALGMVRADVVGFISLENGQVDAP